MVYCPTILNICMTWKPMGTFSYKRRHENLLLISCGLTTHLHGIIMALQNRKSYFKMESHKTRDIIFKFLESQYSDDIIERIFPRLHG